jgi:hypothetical protein
MLDKLSKVNKALAAYLLAALGGIGLRTRTEWVAREQMGDRGQLGFGTIIAAIVVVITVMLAVIVVDQFDQSLGSPDSSQLSQSNQDVLTGFADMTSLVGPLLLVAIAVVIIGLVQRIRG